MGTPLATTIATSTRCSAPHTPSYDIFAETPRTPMHKVQVSGRKLVLSKPKLRRFIVYDIVKHFSRTGGKPILRRPKRYQRVYPRDELLLDPSPCLFEQIGFSD
jgi:hypothetical protein